MTAPEWVPWPTHAGWWWMYDESCPKDDPEMTVVSPNLSVYTAGNEGSLRPVDNIAGLHFLDAQLTPPTPPEER